MKRLLIILPDSPVKPCGGLGERFLKLIPFLEKEFEITIFCHGQGGNISNTRCFEIKAPPIGGEGLCALMWEERILEKLDFTPDIVLGADHITVVICKNIAKAFKAKYVQEWDLAYYSFSKSFDFQKDLQVHPDLLDKANVINFFEYIGNTTADLILTCSEFYKKEIPKEFKLKQEAISIPNGIDFESYELEYEPFVFPGDFEKNIIYIGRMNSQKNVQLLTDFRCHYKGNSEWITVRNKDILVLPNNTALHFIGGSIAGDQFKAVEKTCKSNPQKFHIPFLRGEEKIRAIKSADAVLFPSMHEPFGIVGLEAMAAKTPLITTMQGGISDYANCSNAIACAPDVKDIQKAITFALEFSHEDMVENAFKTAKQFTWQSASNKMINALNAL